MTEYSESYWNELLDQYKSGTISDKNRYALEKRALDDPFLFDALEGYSLYNEVEVENETQKSRIFTLPRIAAAASVVFLISTIFLLKNNISDSKNENQSIAMVLDKSEDKGKSSHNANVSESMPEVDGDILEVASKKESEQQPNVESEVSKPETKPTVAQTEIQPANTKEDLKLLTSTITHKKDKETELTFDKLEEVIGEVIEVNGSVAEAESKSFQEKPSSNSAYDTDLEFSEVADASEDSVSSISAKKKVKDKEVLAIYKVEPGIGVEDFELYAAQKIKERGLTQNPEIEIVIEFTVDKFGMLTKFTHIVEGENKCSECAGFAIHILSQSGVWKIEPEGTVGRARYTFKF